MEMQPIKSKFNFKNPPNEFGEVSFFWWNGDEITKEKLQWVLDQLKSNHICGLQINYCHSNSGGRSYGLTMQTNPKIFSEEWWDTVGWFISECKKYDISVSLSDYTLVTPGQGFFTDWVLEKHIEMVGQVLIRKEGKIQVEKVPYSINPMTQGIGEAYIEEFYGEFERRFPEECGKGINFFFSDELQFNVRGNLWCDDFEKEFFKRKGYDITKKWEAIFEDIGSETAKIRLDYYDVIVQLSEERFFKKIYDWHENRGMTFGCDHGGRGYDITEFGDYFRTMKWNQGPGSDQPNLASDVIKAKCAASIAHMYQRKRVWLEGFYGSGWATGCDDVIDATFRNFALGYNLLSLHGLYYSTHGSMWEWAPPCNHHHMPYWQPMGEFLECSKRLSYLLAEGFHCCDVGIVYPVAAAEVDQQQGMYAANTAFDVGRLLYANKIDFDFIDFESIQRATINDGALNVSNEKFKIIIVPEMKAVRFGMMEKLKEFSNKGGVVIFIKCVPTSSDRIGSDDEKLNKIVEKILENGYMASSNDEAISIIQKSHIPDISTSADNVYFQHRKIEDKDYYLTYRVPFGTTVQFRAEGCPIMFDPWTGEKYKLEGYAPKTVEFNGDTFHVTEIAMPLTEREMFVVMFEKDENEWSSLSSFCPFSNDDEVISMDGEWESELLPTMDNKYGDWRLPAFDGYIAAEAREMEYCFCDNELDYIKAQEWKKSVYSYGTFFHVAQGEIDEQKLILTKKILPNMQEYRFSMKYGVEGDAGGQNSYHGLKGLLSDEFLTMGKKRLIYANSDSVYEGEGPYYFFTTILVGELTTVSIETGDYKPDRIWVDHAEITKEIITLEKGRHYILLRYPKAGRSYFVLRKGKTFKQELSLVTNWFKNSDIISFDAMPEKRGKYCCYRFKTPVGAKTMTINSKAVFKAFIKGAELERIDKNKFLIDKESSVEVTIVAKQEGNEYDTALFDSPITFEIGKGKYNTELSLDEQGLGFYSGGITLKKKIVVNKDERRKFFKFDSKIGCAAEIYVNDQKVAVLLTKPYLCEITKYLFTGENEIKVIAYNDLHNHMKTIPTNYNEKH